MAIAKRFDEKVIDYVKRRKHLEGKAVRLLQYASANGQVELSEYGY
jgi:hypothetical protein